MEDFKIKVGDLVRLRDDLEDGKSYDGIYFFNFMKFNEFEIIEKILADDTIIIRKGDEDYYYPKEMIVEVKRPNYTTIYKRKEAILDEKEKEYLSNVIRPFRNRVEYIVKRENKTKLFIHIQLKDDCAYLPDFKENTMYKNLKRYKEYTLEELGL